MLPSTDGDGSGALFEIRQVKLSNATQEPLEDRIDLLRNKLQEMYRQGYAAGQQDLLSASMKSPIIADTESRESQSNTVLAASEAPEPVTTHNESIQTRSDFVEYGRKYKITNLETGDVLDLSGPNQNVMCRKSHGGKTQQWTVLWRDGLCAFRCVANGRYIDNVHKNKSEWSKLAGVEREAFGWDVVHRANEHTYDIYWKGARLVWDQCRWSGSLQDANLHPHNDNINQHWIFDEV